MNRILLIHGAWGGAWVFDELAQALGDRGHHATAIDLPGHGDDRTPIGGVTMDAYVDRVAREVASIGGNVVLGGHSLAGSVISAVAERMPEHISSLIYMCALLPKDGESPIELMQSDEGGQLLPRMEFSADKTYATVAEGTVREVFLHDLDDPDRIAELVPRFANKQATQPFMIPADLSESRFGSVSKAYIRCEHDRVMSTRLQERMIASWDVDRVLSLESGHFPIFSMTGHLADAIDEAIGTAVHS